MPNANRTTGGQLVAVSVSSGGVPKRPVAAATVTQDGILGDAHAHAKHNRPDRAISLIDEEILAQLNREGFALSPGRAGENLTVVGTSVQKLPSGTLLTIGDVVLRLEQPRKPCYVLDAIDPRLQAAIVGRCGYMASVVRPGRLFAGLPIGVAMPSEASPCQLAPDPIATLPAHRR